MSPDKDTKTGDSKRWIDIATLRIGRDVDDLIFKPKLFLIKL